MTHVHAHQTVSIDPHLLVIFGGTGDLARRKLIPALYRLLEHRGFTDRSAVLAVGTRRIGDEEYRELAREALVDAGIDRDEAAAWCASAFSYQSLEDGFGALEARMSRLEGEHELSGNRAHYLALPLEVVPGIVDDLGRSASSSDGGWTRLVVEKPFGEDTPSAVSLNERLHRWFDERQIFRIDHYLAKETVQNLLAFRFANPVFESSWNRDRIDSVQITVAETLGLEGRARYFDQAGIIRDIVQNHLLQVLSLVAMEPPVKLDSGAIRDEKVKVLRSIYPVKPEQAVLGQYEAGRIDGSPVPGYLEEEGVDPDSRTPTYAALRTSVDTWRWRGVPFVVRAGKRLHQRRTEIAVRFQEPPLCLFEVDGECTIDTNVLYLTLQPDEGFELRFGVKEPGEGYDVASRPLRFAYADAFGALPDAYETVLADMLAGDQTLFVRADEVEEAWRIVTPLLDADHRPEDYPAGSWGPEAATRLLDGDTWLIR